MRDVRTNRTAEKEFVERHAPLYVDLDDLETIRERVEARRDYEVSKAADLLLDENEPPPDVDMSDIRKKYDDRTEGEQGGHFTSRTLEATMLAVETGSFTTGADKDRILLNRVKSDVARLDPSRYGKGLRVGYASDVAINVEELDALEEDLSKSSVLVVVAVMAAIVVYFSWWKSIPVLIPPLLLATVYAFAIASLPPMRITELNSNTAFLGSIIVGNGINVGLVLLARYREERDAGKAVEDALIIAVWGARVGTLAAAAAAGVSYASLLVTEFRGFRQFGYIGGVGMFASWGTAFVLVPPLLAWLDRDGRPRERTARAKAVMRGLTWLIRRGAPVIVAAAAALTALAAYEASKLDASHLEYDFSKLRRADTWKNGEGYWGRKMDALLGHFLTPTVILSDSRAQARAIETKVRASVDHGALHSTVARVVGADDVLPPDQPAKIREAARIRESADPEDSSSHTAQGPERCRSLSRSPLILLPITVADLPHSFTEGLVERDGTIGRTVLVYPRPSNALWKADSIHRFVSTLRDIAATDVGDGSRPARVAGSIPLSSDILASIGRDAPIASTVSFLGVVAVVLMLVGVRKVSLYVLGSLLVGVLWLVGATVFFGIKINFANFIAFPITFGIGVDYSVNVMTRFVQDGSRDVTGAVRSTGGAVALCSLTTIIGYSSLLLAKNRALFLFGLVAVIGEIACLTVAVVALPALLTLLRGRADTLDR